MKKLWIILIVALLILSILLPVAYVEHQSRKSRIKIIRFISESPFGGNTTSQAKLLIDKVKGYTNLFIVDSCDLRYPQ